MARSCADVEPYVNRVKQDITFGFGAADVRNFDFENGPMSICRQLFMSLFYKNFKDLVRVSVKNGNVHLTVPSTLSASPADIPSDDDMASAGSVEYAPIPEGPRLSDVSSLPKSDIRFCAPRLGRRNRVRLLGRTRRSSRLEQGR